MTHDLSATRSRRLVGVYASLISAFLLGWAPILGKLAYRARVDPLTLAALRTLVAALFLWAVYLLIWRDRMRLTAALLWSCLLVGAINGVGSLFYYTGLSRLDASRAALLGSLHPLWVVLFLSASGQRIRPLTLAQLCGALLGALLITSPWVSGGVTDLLGVMLMVASAAVNGWYLVMGQWVLADVPAGSGTLYILTGMAITVAVARLLTPGAAVDALAGIASDGWVAILALGLTTALSRLAMFIGLERLGGVRTALLSVIELAVSLALAFVFLGDRMTWHQWLGAALLLGGGVLARVDVERDTTSSRSFNPLEG